ncbi:MAG: molybdopterin synthase catalytic subunit MoaE [Pseudomonadales bacterium]|jgi:molybdopterin synthase catalytic subunit|nr:molybdopterin synthase catalytic subunit MoaE [Pseudomonadales bacterium]MDP7146495.1 molybdopterin synthase catalytic subunit MoaE [Pseudomonadales bacterium]MDP7358291.1 molybdopterin synthase catalytic subunit MoaE [Pseudomonadales bacterium]MDP7597772.1 molybdopterin synthase catalytic subunit MoaE [Pseudomonadales bacterium]HJN52341.1 molybdopterin synthase catalytic subunit MoaE [Pseudomonadales bacterium]|tara:strand:- start:833 stop:1285 length:453 start_codon:yes stop_codon:yes gene_type:complete
MIRIQPEDFSVDAEVTALRRQSRRIGAIVTFIGLVRDLNDDDEIRTLFLEHYPGMTEKSLTKIVGEAMQRWELIDVTVVHRVGRLQPEDQIVLVAVASGHRKSAFAAAEFIMDYLKTRAPFWKKEETATGSRWLETRSSDIEASAEWDRN